MSDDNKEKKYVKTEEKYEDLLRMKHGESPPPTEVIPTQETPIFEPLSLREFIENKGDRVARVTESKEKEYEPLLIDPAESRVPDDSEVITLLEDEKIKMSYLKTDTAKKIMDKYKKTEKERSIIISIDRTLSKLKEIAENFPSEISETVGSLMDIDTLGELYALDDFLIDLLEKYASLCQEFRPKPNVVIFYPGDVSTRLTHNRQFDPEITRYLFRKGIYRKCLGCNTIQTCSKLDNLSKSTRYLKSIKEAVDSFGDGTRTNEGQRELLLEPEVEEEEELLLLTEEEIMSGGYDEILLTDEPEEPVNYLDKLKELVHMLKNPPPLKDPPKPPPNSKESPRERLMRLLDNPPSGSPKPMKIPSLITPNQQYLKDEIAELKKIYEPILAKYPNLDLDKVSKELKGVIKDILYSYDELQTIDELVDKTDYISPEFIGEFRQVAESIKKYLPVRIPKELHEAPSSREALNEELKELFRRRKK